MSRALEEKTLAPLSRKVLFRVLKIAHPREWDSVKALSRDFRVSLVRLPARERLAARLRAMCYPRVWESAKLLFQNLITEEVSGSGHDQLVV